jgi:chaperonin GroES
MPTFEPLSDYLLIRRLDPVETSKLHIPERAKERPLEGIVVAVGPGRLDADYRRVPLQVQAGARVLFRKYGGTEIQFDGVLHLVCREIEILGIISDTV